jgi:GTP cyclohydrolase I
VTRHELEIRATCPVDGSEDVYECVVETARIVPVETILDEVKIATKHPLYQEELTRKLADALCTKVTTVGTHSNVRTTCEALP